MSSGAIGARLSADASTVKSIVADALALIVQNIATVTAALIIAFAANWILAIIVLLVTPIMVLQGYLQAKCITGFSANAKVSSQYSNTLVLNSSSTLSNPVNFGSGKIRRGKPGRE